MVRIGKVSALELIVVIANALCVLSLVHVLGSRAMFVGVKEKVEFSSSENHIKSPFHQKLWLNFIKYFASPC